MPTNLIADKRIAIIGGGPVGLTTALLLQQKGADVKLYERDASIESRITGGSLDIHQHTGQLALKAAGILEEFYRVSWPPAEKMTTRNGEIVAEEFAQEETKHVKPEIDRNDLRQLLCKHINDKAIIWDRKLVSLEQQSGQYLLHFEGGITETADVVIGANGGRSNLRYFVNDAVPQYTNTYLLQGDILHPKVDCPGFVALYNDSNIMVIADGHALATHYVANGALVFEISFRQPENWFSKHQIDLTDKALVVDFLDRVFDNWSPTYKELFRASQGFRGYPMRYIPLDIPWKEHHHITLIGDAAHLMPPFAGIGVNIGLVDALTLTENLTNGQFESIDAAIADYETKMFVYAKNSLKASLQAERNIHANKNPGEVLQDRNEWNEQLANPKIALTINDATLAEFHTRVGSTPALGKTLKFVVGEKTIFIDGTNAKNRSNNVDLLADCTITLSPATFQDLLSGKVKTMIAFRSGKLKVKGDMGVAMTSNVLFE